MLEAISLQKPGSATDAASSLFCTPARHDDVSDADSYCINALKSLSRRPDEEDVSFDGEDDGDCF